MVGHPDQQMHKLSEQNITFSVVDKVLFEGCIRADFFLFLNL